MKLKRRHLIACVLAFTGAALGSSPASAGAPTAIYTFQGKPDGDNPTGNLVADPAGNLYGVTEAGGSSQGGAVFELSPPVAPSTSWTESVIYSFSLSGDGYAPIGGLVRDATGNLYGTTVVGTGIRNCDDCGTAFKLSPPATGSKSWTYTTIYRFRPVDGLLPEARMIFDSSGNLYGTTYGGGLHPGCCGVVFELSPPQSGQGLWTETVLHVFSGGADGRGPRAGLTFDSSGNLYGTTVYGGLGGSCCGVVFELSPPAGGTGAWTETVLHTFVSSDGRTPQTDLVFDASGNLYGAAGEGEGNGSICYDGCGAVFELSPPVGGSGPWSEKTIYRFPGATSVTNPLTVTYLKGNLYGPAQSNTGSPYLGGAFVLTPSAKRYWNISADSSPSNAGNDPDGSLIINPAVTGATTFYGVAYNGGSTGYGTIFSWTP